MMKNILLFILILFIEGFLARIITLIVYPIVFLFRHRITSYINTKIEENEEFHFFELKPRVKKWKLYFSPLFWGFLFTTGLTEKCTGPSWYKKEKKEKWFSEFTTEEDPHPIPQNFKQRLQYFWLSYCWSGWRNGNWALTEWFFREGGTPWYAVRVKKSKMRDTKTADAIIMPSTSFKDRDGTDRNNSGPYIKYVFDSENTWGCLQEGYKIQEFETHRGNTRFYAGKVKVYKFDKLKKFLVMELLAGWNSYNGIPTTAARFMWKKMDDFALQDYNKYLEYLKTI